MKEHPDKAIANQFREFCNSTWMIMPYLQGLYITCSHGRYGIGYENTDMWLDIARRKHVTELSSSKETRYNWL